MQYEFVLFNENRDFVMVTCIILNKIQNALVAHRYRINRLLHLTIASVIIGLGFMRIKLEKKSHLAN